MVCKITFYSVSHNYYKHFQTWLQPVISETQLHCFQKHLICLPEEKISQVSHYIMLMSKRFQQKNSKAFFSNDTGNINITENFFLDYILTFCWITIIFCDILQNIFLPPPKNPQMMQLRPHPGDNIIVWIGLIYFMRINIDINVTRVGNVIIILRCLDYKKIK